MNVRDENPTTNVSAAAARINQPTVVCDIAIATPGAR
jgi:hypothetical protein